MTDTDDWINEDKDDFLGMPHDQRRTYREVGRHRCNGDVCWRGDRASGLPKQSTKPVNTRPRVDIDEDNLRGFDPALEDDLHDNGMRRYMENDDEEGCY